MVILLNDAPSPSILKNKCERQWIMLKLSVEAISSVLEVVGARRSAALVSCCKSTSLSRISEQFPKGPLTPHGQLFDDEVEYIALQSEVIRSVASSSNNGIIGSALEGRRLTKVELELANISCSFNRCDLSAAKLSGGVYRKCSFNLTVLNQCEFIEAKFHSCTFVGSDMQQVDARRAHFANCQFLRCDMTNWSAGGALFLQCSFKKCDLSHWEYDRQTQIQRPNSWNEARVGHWHQSSSSLRLHGPCSPSVLEVKS